MYQCIGAGAPETGHRRRDMGQGPGTRQVPGYAPLECPDFTVCLLPGRHWHSCSRAQGGTGGIWGIGGICPSGGVMIVDHG